MLELPTKQVKACFQRVIILKMVASKEKKWTKVTGLKKSFLHIKSIFVLSFAAEHLFWLVLLPGGQHVCEAGIGAEPT